MYQICINRIEKSTKVEGFGNRYCIWLQGCSIRCPGCSNENMWEFGNAPTYSVDQVIEDIFQQKQIEGLTIMGGEPFDQKQAVSALVMKATMKGYSIILFTGYIYEELKKMNNRYVNSILKYTDLLIDGPFIQQELDFSRPWIGSKNQRYLFLSDKYSQYDLDRAILRPKLEIRIKSNGRIRINGMGDIDKLRQKIVVEENKKIEDKK